MTSKKNFKNFLPVLLGNTLESYDFCLYGLLAPVFAKVFFPSDFQNSLLAAFVVFSVAYIARPFGSVFWGYIADKYGRKPTLIGTLTLMALPAIGMAVLPSYETIGIYACIIIIVLRLIQGFSFGGEFPAVMVVSQEISTSKNRGLFGCFPDLFALFGYIIGVVLLTILNHFLTTSDFHAFGWRILFFISIIFIIIVSYIRIYLIETQPKTKLATNPFLDVLKHDIRKIVIIFFYMLIVTCLYFNFMFYNHVLIQSKSNFILSNFKVQLFASLFLMFMIIFMGYISDKINRLKFAKMLYLSLILLSAPIYYLFLSEKLILIVFGYVIMGVFASFAIATFVPLVVDQARKSCKVSTVGIALSFATIFGSFTPVINEFLIDFFYTAIAPSFYVVFCCFSAILATYFMKNKKSIRHKMKG